MAEISKTAPVMNVLFFVHWIIVLDGGQAAGVRIVRRYHMELGGLFQIMTVLYVRNDKSN